MMDLFYLTEIENVVDLRRNVLFMYLKAGERREKKGEMRLRRRKWEGEKKKD